MKHDFLKSIGFTEIDTNEELYRILGDVVAYPDQEEYFENPVSPQFAMYTKYFGEHMGITVAGIFIGDDFHMEYYFPFYKGCTASTYEHMEITKFSDRLAFAGVCDELRLGVTLIFTIQNTIHILRTGQKKQPSFRLANVAIGGLGLGGTVLLPVIKNAGTVHKRILNEKKRIDLIKKAREGNQKAIDYLTINDMDTYSMLSQRVEKEDILSIVESSFIPHGIECDQYDVIGEIINVKEVSNKQTEELCWVLQINCNDIVFDICINQKDLIGEPMIGRRFKGMVQLMAQIQIV